MEALRFGTVGVGCSHEGFTECFCSVRVAFQCRFRFRKFGLLGVGVPYDCPASLQFCWLRVSMQLGA